LPRSERAAEVDGRVVALRAEDKAAEDKLKRLYALVEDGVTDLDDILAERLSALKRERDRTKAALDRIQFKERPAAAIAPELIERFGSLMRKNVTTGEIPFRKAWLQAIVDRIEIDDDVIPIVGDKANLEAVIAACGATATAGVRGSIRKWRTRHDSNV
jgi:hypothetical protein